jgi:hypothetical protein
MNMMLPESIIERVLQLPEYSQGVNKVKVRLKNGKVYSAVFVAWGKEIIRVGQSTQVPFEASEIVEVWNDL